MLGEPGPRPDPPVWSLTYPSRPARRRRGFRNSESRRVPANATVPGFNRLAAGGDGSNPVAPRPPPFASVPSVILPKKTAGSPAVADLSRHSLAGDGGSSLVVLN
jgi:hypothetical protein